MEPDFPISNSRTRRKQRTVCLDIRLAGIDAIVATHAYLRIGERRVLGVLDVLMAIAAIHSHLTDVKFVGESDRLLGLIANAGILGIGIVVKSPGKEDSAEYNADDNLSNQGIDPPREDRCQFGCSSLG